MINTDRLNIFLLVAETQSFSRAARHLHISQPTVSKQIKELENELKVELFIRSPSGVQLTDAGNTLIPWAQKLLRDNLELQNMMVTLDQEPSGTLKIACSTTAGKYVLPILAARFRTLFTSVQISILTCSPENIAAQILEDQADLGVISREICDAMVVECQPFFKDVISLIVPSEHKFAARPFIEPDELLDEPFILREATSGTRQVMFAQLAQYDIGLNDPNILLEVGNAEAIVEAVIAGYGISFVSRKAAARAIQQGLVREVNVRGIQLVRNLNMVRKELCVPNRAKDAFWSFIHNEENKDLINTVR